MQAYCQDCGKPCDVITDADGPASECCGAEITTEPKECDCCRQPSGRLIQCEVSGIETYACPTCQDR